MLLYRWWDLNTLSMGNECDINSILTKIELYKGASTLFVFDMAAKGKKTTFASEQFKF